MTELSKRFEQIVRSTQKRLYEQGALMPVKTQDGIMVGDATIVGVSSFKDILFRDELKYEKVSLNDSAIKIANVLACNKPLQKADQIYDLDQKYAKNFSDCAFYLDKYHRACELQDQFKSDLYWIRYQEAKYTADYYKDRIRRISIF
jgi:hypothetical protein